jgi:hypothetical protein
VMARRGGALSSRETIGDEGFAKSLHIVREGNHTGMNFSIKPVSHFQIDTNQKCMCTN